MYPVDAKKWDPPARFATQPSAPIVLPPSSTTFSAISGTGHWNNLDVYVNADAGWWAGVGGINSVVFILYVLEQGIRVLKGIVNAQDIAHQTGFVGGTSKVRGMVFSLRGHPCDGFDVELTSSATASGQGLLYVEAWGHEASVPDVLYRPQDTTNGMPNPPIALPQRQSFTWGWYPAGGSGHGTWLPVLVDSTGAVIISGGASVPANVHIVPGNGVGDLVGTAASGGAAVALAASAVYADVLVSSDFANDPAQYIGVAGSGVTAANCGVQLAPGDSVSRNVGNTDEIFVVGSAAGQKYRVSWIKP